MIQAIETIDDRAMQAPFIKIDAEQPMQNNRCEITDAEQRGNASGARCMGDKQFGSRKLLARCVPFRSVSFVGFGV